MMMLVADCISDRTNAFKSLFFLGWIKAYPTRVKQKKTTEMALMNLYYTYEQKPIRKEHTVKMEKVYFRDKA